LTLDLDEEVHHHQPEEDEHLCDIDSTQYEFPFENLVLEGGGTKGLAYCGVGRVSVLIFLIDFSKTFIGSNHYLE